MTTYPIMIAAQAVNPAINGFDLLVLALIVAAVWRATTPAPITTITEHEYEYERSAYNTRGRCAPVPHPSGAWCRTHDTPHHYYCTDRSTP